MTFPPSGRQVELVHGEQRAVVVENGGGLRSYTAGDGPVVDGYAESELASGGRGQVLLPWPNRLAGGRWDDAGETRQLPLSEAGRGNAIHGLVRWAAWDVRQDGAAGAVAEHVLVPQPGYPFRLHCRLGYRLGEGGLTVDVRVRNDGGRPAPFGIGFHPYLYAGDPLVDALTVTVPAETHLLLDEGIPVGREPVADSGRDLRSAFLIGDAVIDDAFTDIRRSDGAPAGVSVSGPSGTTRLWFGPGFEYLQLFTGDTLAPQARRRGLAVEPMTCPPNALATGEGLLHLEPGAAAELVWGISPG